MYEDYDEDFDDMKFEKFAPKNRRKRKSEDWTNPHRDDKLKDKQRTEALRPLRKEDEDEDEED